MNDNKGLIERLIDAGVSAELLEKVISELKLDVTGLEMTGYREAALRHKFNNIDKYTQTFREWVWGNYKERAEFMPILIAIELQREVLRMIFNWAVTDGLIKGGKLK